MIANRSRWNAWNISKRIRAHQTPWVALHILGRLVVGSPAQTLLPSSPSQTGSPSHHDHHDHQHHQYDHPLYKYLFWAGSPQCLHFPHKLAFQPLFFPPVKTADFHDHDDDDDDGDDDDEDDDDEGEDNYDDDSPLQPPFIPSHEDSVGIAPPAPTPWLLSYLTVLPKS